MACFHLCVIQSFYMNGTRYESGDAIEIDEISVCRDLLARGRAVAAPANHNGMMPPPEFLEVWRARN